MEDIKFKAWAYNTAHNLVPNKIKETGSVWVGAWNMVTVTTLNLSTGTMRGYYLRDTYKQSTNYTKGKYTLMQWTGLKDKNGVDIYEGDICLYDDTDQMSCWTRGEKFVVIKNKGRFSARMAPFNEFDGTNQNTMNEEVEDCVTVIGNIKLTPELIK